MPIQVNIHEAKTNLSKLLLQVQEGQEIVIAKNGQPVAKLIPATQCSGKRVPGSAKGKVKVEPDFNNPLPEQVMESFEK
ncbi:type II toxin-antitoxin system Phd/YefM family antitoxin [Dethiobacter alkaliphilus]|uniref:Antitoxin n=1 Tax=Dethiobacter alkaliphilus AHT 1 TaxID=555088 RepID=C0GKQ2_DETAL|nr:type II toxin-antitoxin system Phd/YefM family antitoxin [Dethiobacter alkaliphilus]EEG76074.1 prevent-host-death family protein [Dethiobacter alkaliphilus AHT 1]MCW3489787.1 type II toxin-antitoxin system Phd/YefM family antitoxin [Dethiobacter alkaliphilus]